MAHILNEYFDKIYCITVHDFYDRHEFFRKHFQGINYEFMLSPPASTVSPVGYRNATETSIILGQLSCIWNAKLNGFKRIAILEDDTKLIATEDAMKEFFNELPEGWDFLYMSNPSWAAGIWDAWDQWTTPYSEHVKKIKWGNSCSFNAVQSHKYDELAETLIKGLDPADFVWFNLFGKYKNAYCPAKGFFGDTMSTPHESVRNRFDLNQFLPSRVQHSF